MRGSALMASTTPLSLEPRLALGIHCSRMTASIHPSQPENQVDTRSTLTACRETIAPGTGGWT
jgi:hypothetical protein